jgi:YHS domain-containing protein
MLSFSAVGFAEDIDLKPQTVCPVMGGKIDKNEYVDYQGQRVYFCCLSCKAAFLKEPGKYMKKLAEEKVLLEKHTPQY